jgi:hypothetical protein
MLTIHYLFGIGRRGGWVGVCAAVVEVGSAAGPITPSSFLMPHLHWPAQAQGYALLHLPFSFSLLIGGISLQVVDVPDNIQEVLSACILIYLVRVLVNKLATRLPRPPPAPASAAGGLAGSTPAAVGGALAADTAAAAGIAGRSVKGLAGNEAVLGAVAAGAAAGAVSAACKELSKLSELCVDPLPNVMAYKLQRGFWFEF